MVSVGQNWRLDCNKSLHSAAELVPGRSIDTVSFCGWAPCHAEAALCEYTSCNTLKQHAYIHARIHAYIHASMPPCIHAYMHPCIDAYMHPCLHSFLLMQDQLWKKTFYVSSIKILWERFFFGKRISETPNACLLRV